MKIAKRENNRNSEVSGVSTSVINTNLVTEAHALLEKFGEQDQLSRKQKI